MVIEAMEGLGPDNRYLQALRQTAPAGRDALNGGDLAGFGRTMIENHQAQGNLHPDLISAEAEAVAEIANQYGAAGWKVNGAGGAGGSLTILSSDDSDEKQAMLRALEAEDPEFSILPIKLSPKGLSVQVDRP
jgi:D-glycero-alpha-D-manno-heptose-7-phosphate kinase